MSDDLRRALVEWKMLDGELAPQTPLGELESHWYKGQSFHVLPPKSDLRGAGIESVLEGWRPPGPIIHADSRVLAFGSCFASHFILWLGDHGFNRSVADSPYNMLLRYGFAFENVPVIAQQFRWAFGQFDASRALWVDRDKTLVQATDENRRAVRESLEQADVLILTLGLSEIWYDSVTMEPLWRALPSQHFDEQRHAFRVLDVRETVAALDEVDALVRQFLPRLKVIFTVSPVRLRATFRPVSAVTANSASKAILRAAVDQFLRERPDRVNETYFYFPSYELVTEVFRDPFLEDNRHVYQSVVDRVLAVFARAYTSLPPDETIPEQYLVDRELQDKIAELERRVTELQKICDERQAVIDELDRAARERLELIQRLDALCQQYQRQLSAPSG